MIFTNFSWLYTAQMSIRNIRKKRELFEVESFTNEICVEGFSILINLLLFRVKYRVVWHGKY